MSAPLIGSWEATKHGEVPALSRIVSRTEPGPVLFLGDLHLDHPKADRAGLKRVLDEAVERDAAIVLVGDVFDVMQGRNDRRSSKGALQARYGRDDYLTAVLEDVTDFLLPYARHLWLILDGNHEATILKYNEVSLTRLLVHNLNTIGDGHVLAPGYQTWAVLKTAHHAKGDDRNRRVVTPMWLTHGSGGNARVTKGAIGMQRRAVTYPDASFIISGHLHTDLYVPHVQHRLSQKGRVHNVKQKHFQVSAWKNDHGNAADYANMKGFDPTMPSGWWCEVYRARGENPVPPHFCRFYEVDPV